MGVAMGCPLPSMTAGVMSSSPLQTAGLASGILNSSRQVCGELGVALFGALVEAAQIRGMLWALVFAAAIWSRPSSWSEIHSGTAFVKVLARPFSIFLLIVGFLALSTLRNDSRTGS